MKAKVSVENFKKVINLFSSDNKVNNIISLSCNKTDNKFVIENLWYGFSAISADIEDYKGKVQIATRELTKIKTESNNELMFETKGDDKLYVSNGEQTWTLNLYKNDIDADMQCGAFDINKYLFADHQLSLDGKWIVDTFVGCIKKAKALQQSNRFIDHPDMVVLNDNDLLQLLATNDYTIANLNVSTIDNKTAILQNDLALPLEVTENIIEYADNQECIGLNISAVSAKDAQYQSDFAVTFLYKNNVSVNLEHKQLIARGIQYVLSFFPKRIDDTNTYTHIDKSDLINKIKVQDKMIYENDKQIFRFENHTLRLFGECEDKNVVSFNANIECGGTNDNTNEYIMNVGVQKTLELINSKYVDIVCDVRSSKYMFMTIIDDLNDMYCLKATIKTEDEQ